MIRVLLLISLCVASCLSTPVSISPVLADGVPKKPPKQPRGDRIPEPPRRGPGESRPMPDQNPNSNPNPDSTTNSNPNPIGAPLAISGPPLTTIPSSGFRGVVTIRNWFGKYIAPTHSGILFWHSFRPDYSDSAYEWQMYPSHHGGYFIRGWTNGCQAFCSDSYYFWQTDMGDSQLLTLHSGGADDWETYFLEPHPSGGYALRSYANGNRFVCAEPDNHSIHLIANRDQAQQWEQFHIDVVKVGIPDDPSPPPPKKMAYTCTNCGRVMGECDGGVPGETHTWCYSPLGNCKCPHCDQQYYSVTHTHYF